MPNHQTHDVPFFLQVTPQGTGAVAVFHFYGDDTALGGIVDKSVRRRGNIPYEKVLGKSELRYGLLFDDNGDELDEVMVAKPVAGMRVLMCHGGVFICQRIDRYFSGLDLRKIDFKFLDNHIDLVEKIDSIFTPLLAGCCTGTQVDMVLSFREAKVEGNQESVEWKPALLATHHMCLVGPPNAGKSSLLNRLSGFDRAFVHEEAGATRDVVAELVDLAGYAVLVEDLPGFSADAQGIARDAWLRATQRLGLADTIVFVCDASRPWDRETDVAAATVASILDALPSIGDREVVAGNSGSKTRRQMLIVLNKADLGITMTESPWKAYFPDAGTIRACALPGGDAAESLARAFHRLME